jgi:serine/threonine protein kinase
VITNDHALRDVPFAWHSIEFRVALLNIWGFGSPSPQTLCASELLTTMPPAVSPFLPGDIVAGKYRVERQLGAGGMGVVLAATHLDLLEPRALKFLSEAALEDAESVERFLREARAASRLKSEHVTRVFDVGRLPTGMPFMVMEYLEGTDLGAMLKTGGRLSIPVAVTYVLQALEGLAEAHAAGIVHRDLKPANLFLTFRPDGTECVKVLDFGISKIKGGAGEDIDVTKTHAVLGSPHYMSPEQMESSRDVDARSDIWSLGILLYQLITGELPFKGKTMTEVVAVVFSKPPIPPSKIVEEVSPDLEKVILSCLQHDLAKRPQNVGELAKALEPFALTGAGQIVERITRLLQAPIAMRLSSSNPVAIPHIEGLVTPQMGSPSSDGAITQDSHLSPRKSNPPDQQQKSAAKSASGLSEPKIEAALQQAGSVSGAWGATASGVKRRRIPAAAILLTCGAMLVAVAIAIAIVTNNSPPRDQPLANSVLPVESAAPISPASTAPLADTSVAALPAPSAAPEASAAATATTSKTRSTGRTKTPPPSGTGTDKDPFGMDRK